MKKKLLFKSISFMLMIAAFVILLYCAAAIMQGASNISEANCMGIATLCGIAAVVFLKLSKDCNTEK